MEECLYDFLHGRVLLSSPIYKRIPHVRRLEYLVAFLESFEGDELNMERAEENVRAKIKEVEIEKARALGRQRPQARQGRSTVEECMVLATQLGLLDREKRLTADATKMLDPEGWRPFLLERAWRTYIRLRQLTLLVRDRETLDLPFYLYDWDPAARQEVIAQYGIDLAGFQFEIIRDFATQLGLINWYPTEEKHQVLYPVACVALRSEILALADRGVGTNPPGRCVHQAAIETGLLRIENGKYIANRSEATVPKDYHVLLTDFEEVFVKDNRVALDEFEQAIWKDYLRLGEMRPRFPVLYPELRNRVCAELRLTDQAFDQHLAALIEGPSRLSIYPGSGTLSYAGNLGHLSKLLPAKTSRGEFMTYLKIDRRGTG